MAVTWNADFFLILIVAALAGALAAVLIGLPALRLPGLYLAVTTLALGAAMQNFFLNRSYVVGRSCSRPRATASWRPVSGTTASASATASIPTRGYYYFCLVILGGALLMARAYRRNRAGRAVLAVRENVRAASSYGVNLVRTKLGAFAVSGALAAIAGVLLAFQSGSIDSSTYGIEPSVRIFVTVVIGGLTSLGGAVFGTVLLEGVRLFGEDAIENLSLLVTGPGLLLVLLLLPGGFAEGLYRMRDSVLRWIAKRNGIDVPSLVADRRVETGEDQAEVIEAAEHSVEQVDAFDHLERGAGGVKRLARYTGGVTARAAARARRPQLRRRVRPGRLRRADARDPRRLRPLRRGHPGRGPRLRRLHAARRPARSASSPTASTGSASRSSPPCCGASAPCSPASCPCSGCSSRFASAPASAASSTRSSTRACCSDYYPPETHPRVFGVHRAGQRGRRRRRPRRRRHRRRPRLAGGVLRPGHPDRASSSPPPSACASRCGARASTPSWPPTSPTRAHVPFGEARRQLFARPDAAAPVGRRVLLRHRRPAARPSSSRCSSSRSTATARGAAASCSSSSAPAWSSACSSAPGYAVRAAERKQAGRLAVITGAAFVAFGAGLVLMAAAPWSLGSAVLRLRAVDRIRRATSPPTSRSSGQVAPPRVRSQAYAWAILIYGCGGLSYLVLAGIGENGSLPRARRRAGRRSSPSPASSAPAPRRFVQRDVEQAANTLAAAVEVREAMRAVDGERPLLVCRGVDVAYGQVQILFGVDVEVKEGEIVALLGTNGAGKSTLLKAICGLVDPIGGAIFFDGRDITHADAVQTAKMGIVQVPGGKAVFPTLTVAEHFKAGTWLFGDEDPAEVERRIQEVLERFPRLRERWDQMAGNLSGGEQQQLALGMAFVAKPKLLIIDELSLGLAPDDRRAAARHGARDPRPGLHDHPRRAVGERRPHRRRRAPTSWRRARSGSPARPPSCSSGATSCARCSSRAAAVDARRSRPRPRCRPRWPSGQPSCGPRRSTSGPCS